MEKDLNKKYDTVEGIDEDINSSKKRLALINPYLSKHKNDKNSPEIKLL